MAKLAVWRVDGRHAESASRQPEPKRVGRSHIALEKHLEDWIVNDVTLIAEGLTLVGRQLSLDDGRLDLLAIDSRDRWVVIEIKQGVLDARTLTQALYYASSLARLNADDLSRKLEVQFNAVGDAKELSEKVKQQLDSEGNEREIAVLLVGAGIHPGLERMNEFLGRFDFPIAIVSFGVFKLESGLQLLIREVVDEPAKPSLPHRRLTVDAIRRTAVDVGVGGQFERFVRIAEQAGLAVQPQRASVRIAPMANRTRFLMYARPRAGNSGGELGIWVGPSQFAEFFDHVSEEAANEVLGSYDDGGFLSGKKLDERLDKIEQFLTGTLRQSVADGELRSRNAAE